MILLKIGYLELLLKNDTGLQTVLKTLAKAVEVDYREYTDPPRMTIKSPVRVSMQVLPETGWKVHREGEDDEEPGTDIIPVDRRQPVPRRSNGHAALPRQTKLLKRLFE